MIGLEISGGLGNQFFRYAYARALYERRKAQGRHDILIVNYGNIDNHGFAGSLHDFRILDHEAKHCHRLLPRYGSLPQLCAFGAFKILCRLFKGQRLARCRQRTLSRLGVMVSESPDTEPTFTPPKS